MIFFGLPNLSRGFSAEDEPKYDICKIIAYISSLTSTPYLLVYTTPEQVFKKTG